MSKPYAVVLPFAGEFHANVDAESEEEAIQKAIELATDFTMRTDADHRGIDDERGWMECATWSPYEHLVEGNMLHVSTNSAYAEEE